MGSSALFSYQVLSIIALIILVAVFGLRLYASLRLMDSGFRLDDGLICISAAAAFIYFTGNLYDHQVTRQIGYMMAGMFPDISFTFLSLSILCLYYRLSAASTFFRTAIVCVATVSVFLLGVTVTINSLKTNLLDLIDWTRSSQENIVYVLTINWVIVAHRIARTISEIFIYVLPLHHLWKLQLDRGTRIRLVMLFALGGLSCICSIALMAVISLSLTTQSFGKNFPPFTIDVLIVLELITAIFCTSLPSLQVYIPKLNQLFGRISNGEPLENAPSATRTEIGSSYTESKTDAPLVSNKKAIGVHVDIMVSRDGGMV